MKHSIILSTALAFGAFAFIGVADVHATNATIDCVNGSTRDNFVSTWQGHDTISVKTQSGQPVCNDVTIYFSSYTLPDNYNGKKFANNPTAFPQQQFDSNKFIIAEGKSRSDTVKVQLPDSCTKHAQTDVYLGPEIKVVGAEGHQGRGIRGTNGNNHIVPKTTCAEQVQPVTNNEQPVTELPKTGSGSAFGAGLAVSILTAGVAYLVRR